MGSAAHSANDSSLPWSGASKRNDHPWHSMCSYLGAFPAAIPRAFIEALTSSGDVVLDPFSGRGTTLLEARLHDRRVVASDLNPIALALSRAKNADVGEQQTLDRIRELESKFQLALYLPLVDVEGEDIRLIYHPHTLAQLCFLKRKFKRSSTPVDDFIRGALLGIMHGKPRKDGTSSYASISMPNTFSMSPDYVRRFVATNQIERPKRNVFDLLAEKIARLFDGYRELGPPGLISKTDAKNLSMDADMKEYAGRAKLIMTSPPYLDVVNYAKQNWIRLWLLGADVDEVHDELDDTLTPSGSIEFFEAALHEMESMLAKDGVIVLVIGDVARSKNSVLSPARDLMRRLFAKDRFEYIGCISDYLEVDGKTTRIWKDTKGKATAIDRVVILSHKRPDFKPVTVTEKVGQLELCPGTYEFNTDTLEQYAREFAGID